MTTIKVPVNDRADMTFEGRELASISTRRPGQPRWTELRLYVKDEGGYVFARVGESAMYHRVTCRKVFGRIDMDPTPVEDIADDDYPCEECSPDEMTEGMVVFEKAKYSAVAVDDARRLLFAMTDRDRVTQELRMSRLSQELLLIAAEQDEGLREATQRAMLNAG